MFFPCCTEWPMGKRRILAGDHLVHVETNYSFEIKHDDGAMHYVIIRWLLMALCSKCLNIIDGNSPCRSSNLLCSKMM